MILSRCYYKSFTKARAEVYVRNGIKFTRRNDLEGMNNGLKILDLDLSRNYRLINVYRVFDPPGRDSGNDFCQISDIRHGYDFVPSRFQKKRPEMTVV